MSTILECIVDVCLPIAARWIVIQIGFFFGSDLNGSTFLWFFTILLCAVVAECFTFQPKSKLKPLNEKTPEVLDEKPAEAIVKVEAINMGPWEQRDKELFPNEDHV